VWVVVFSWLSVRPDSSLRWLYLTLALGPGYYVGLSVLLNIPRVRAALENNAAARARAS
jgi:hypothetical protein